MKTLLLTAALSLCSSLFAQQSTVVVEPQEDFPCNGKVIDVLVSGPIPQDLDDEPMKIICDNGLPVGDPDYERQIMNLWDFDGDGQHMGQFYIPFGWTEFHIWSPFWDVQDINGDDPWFDVGC